MGKYSSIIDTLPRLQSSSEFDDPNHQERVNTLKGEILKKEPRHGTHLALRVSEIRRQKDALKEELSKVNLYLEAYTQLLVDQYEVEATSAITLDNGDRVSVQLEPHAKVVDRDANREWAMKSGLERQLQLPWQTVNAYTKQALLDGFDVPPGVKAWARPKLVFTKGS